MLENDKLPFPGLSSRGAQAYTRGGTGPHARATRARASCCRAHCWSSWRSACQALLATSVPRSARACRPANHSSCPCLPPCVLIIMLLCCPRRCRLFLDSQAAWHAHVHVPCRHGRRMAPLVSELAAEVLEVIAASRQQAGQLPVKERATGKEPAGQAGRKGGKGAKPDPLSWLVERSEAVDEAVAPAPEQAAALEVPVDHTAAAAAPAAATPEAGEAAPPTMQPDASTADATVEERPPKAQATPVQPLRRPPGSGLGAALVGKQCSAFGATLAGKAHPSPAPALPAANGAATGLRRPIVQAPTAAAAADVGLEAGTAPAGTGELPLSSGADAGISLVAKLVQPINAGGGSALGSSFGRQGAADAAASTPAKGAVGPRPGNPGGVSMMGAMLTGKSRTTMGGRDTAAYMPSSLGSPSTATLGTPVGLRAGKPSGLAQALGGSKMSRVQAAKSFPAIPLQPAGAGVTVAQLNARFALPFALSGGRPVRVLPDEAAASAAPAAAAAVAQNGAAAAQEPPAAPGAAAQDQPGTGVCHASYARGSREALLRSCTQCMRVCLTFPDHKVDCRSVPC